MPSFTYTTRAEIEAMVPEGLVERACDPGGDGTEDSGLFDALVAVVGDEVEALVSPSVTVSGLATAPPVLKDAARKLVCEALYRRLATPPAENPWRDDAAAARDRLRLIGDGKLRIDAAQVATVASIYDDEDLDWDLENQDGL